MNIKKMIQEEIKKMSLNNSDSYEGVNNFRKNSPFFYKNKKNKKYLKKDGNPFRPDAGEQIYTDREDAMNAYNVYGVKSNYNYGAFVSEEEDMFKDNKMQKNINNIIDRTILGIKDVLKTMNITKKDKKLVRDNSSLNIAIDTHYFLELEQLLMTHFSGLILHKEHITYPKNRVFWRFFLNLGYELDEELYQQLKGKVAISEFKNDFYLALGAPVELPDGRLTVDENLIRPQLKRMIEIAFKFNIDNNLMSINEVKNKMKEDKLIPHKKKTEDDKTIQNIRKEREKEEKKPRWPSDITDENLDRIAKKIGVDWHKFNKKQFKKGMKIEHEHDDITHGDLLLTAKIVLAHLKENPKYYDALENMEKKLDSKKIETKRKKDAVIKETYLRQLIQNEIKKILNENK